MHPDAALRVKKIFRKVRELADVYPLQRRLFESSWTEMVTVGDTPIENPQDLGLNLKAELDAERSLSNAADELYRTWINYQSARLDLYRDLDLTPP